MTSEKATPTAESAQVARCGAAGWVNMCVQYVEAPPGVGRFAQFDWDAREACEALVEELNGVNEAIAPQLAFLAAIIKGIQGIRPEDIEIEDSNRPVNGLLSHQ